MMRDGIYKIFLAGGGTKGFMIGAVENNRLSGCDQSHHVTGMLRESDGRIKGAMTMTRHAKPDGFTEIANMDVIEISFSGICGASTGEFDARIEGRPDLPIKATFQWVCGF